MKKKLIVLVAMMLCLVTVLAACGGAMKFSKVVGDGTIDYPAFDAAEKLSLEGEVDDNEGDLLYLTSEDDKGNTVHKVYNIATNETVWTATDSMPEDETANGATAVEYEVGLFDQNETSWFAVAKATVTLKITGEETEEEFEFKVELFDAEGESFASATSDDDDIKFEHDFDLILLDDTMYRIAEDGTIAEAFEVSALRELPHLIGKAGDYYYAYKYANDESIGDGNVQYNPPYGIEIYDSNLEMTVSYEAPVYSGPNSYATYSILNNGNVLIQLNRDEGQFAEEYTYTISGRRYTLLSYLLKPDNGKVKEIDLDFVVMPNSEVYTRDNNKGVWEDGGLSEKIENLAYGYFVEDGYVNQAEDAIELVALSNKGKVTGVIADLIPGQYKGEMPELVADQRWIVENENGQVFLIDEKGKVVGEISNSDGSNLSYINADGKLYSMTDLSVAYDYEDENKDLEVAQMLRNGVLFWDSETGAYSIYADGESKTLISATAAEEGKRTLEIVRNKYVVVKDTSGEAAKYEIYNDEGTLLLSTDLEITSGSSTYSATDGTMLIEATDKSGEEEKTVYIRVTVATEEEK